MSRPIIKSAVGDAADFLFLPFCDNNWKGVEGYCGYFLLFCGIRLIMKMKKNLFCLVTLFLLITDLKGQGIEKRYVKDLSTYLIKKWGGEENPIFIHKGSNMYLHLLSSLCNPNLKTNLQYEVGCITSDKSIGNMIKSIEIIIAKYKTPGDAKKAYTFYNKLSESFKPEVSHENQCTIPENFMDGFWLDNNYLVLVQPRGYAWSDWIKLKGSLQKRFKNKA